MDRKTLLAISICFLIYLGWQKYYLEPRMPLNSTAQTALTSGTGDAASSTNPPQNVPPGQTVATPKHPDQTLALMTSKGEAVLSDGSHFFTDWHLNGYKLGISADAAAVDMQSVTRQSGEVELAFDDPSFAYLNGVQGTLTKTATGALWTYEDASVKLTRVITSGEAQPYLDLQVTAEFKNKRPNYAFLSLNSQSPEKDPEAQDRQLVYFTNQSVERVHLKDPVALKEVATPVKYIAATNRYFLMTLVNESPIEPKGLLQPVTSNTGRISMVYPLSGNSIALPFRVFFGPKELDLLRIVEPKLDNAVDFGWFTVFAYPLIKILKWLYQFVNNYGVAIILLTILLKIVTYPLTYKTMKSAKEMAKIQPQLARLREKYKDDKESLNREMMAMMKSHGYNPMAGCLPTLIQMPIFFALYRVLYSSIELFHAPFAFWIQDLSARDPFYVTPVLLSLTMFLQQKLSPATSADPAQQKMMQLMPLIFGAFMLTLPSGLTLYMLINASASIVQQIILNRKLDNRNVTATPARAR